MPLFISKASDPLLLAAERPVTVGWHRIVCMCVGCVQAFVRVRADACGCVCVRAPVRACVREVFAIYDNTI